MNHSEQQQQQQHQHHQENNDINLVNAIAASAVAIADQHERRNRTLLRRNQFSYYNDGQYGYYYYYYPEEDQQQYKFIGIIPWIIRIIKLISIGIIFLISSITIYGTFYWAVMPGHYASRPLFFDYTGTVPYPHQNVTTTTTIPPTTPGTSTTGAYHYQTTTTTTTTTAPGANNNHNNNNYNDKINAAAAAAQIVVPLSNNLPTATETTPSSTTLPYHHHHHYMPWASVDLFAMENSVSYGSETIYSDLIPPLAATTIGSSGHNNNNNNNNRILSPKQAYYVEIHLELPESTINKQLGMFGVAVDLISHPDPILNNDTMIQLATSVRPARIPYESNWLSIVRKMFWVIPLIFGGMKESKVIVITSFRHMLESQDYPLRHVVTRLVGQFSLLQQQQHQQQHWHGRPESAPAQHDHIQHTPQQQQPPPPVEVIGGEVRIGKELNRWQQVLKDWFFTCYILGSMLLFGAHIAASIILQYYWSENNTYDDFGGGDQQYFDPSCDFSERRSDDDDDDGFESLQSNDDNNAEEERNNGDNGANYNNNDNRNTVSRSNDYGGRDSNFEDDDDGDNDDDDDDLENWEECRVSDNKEDGQGERQSQDETPSESSHHRQFRQRHEQTIRYDANRKEDASDRNNPSSSTGTPWLKRSRRTTCRKAGGRQAMPEFITTRCTEEVAVASGDSRDEDCFFDCADPSTLVTETRRGLNQQHSFEQDLSKVDGSSGAKQPLRRSDVKVGEEIPESLRFLDKITTAEDLTTARITNPSECPTKEHGQWGEQMDPNNGSARTTVHEFNLYGSKSMTASNAASDLDEGKNADSMHVVEKETIAEEVLAMTSTATINAAAKPKSNSKKQQKETKDSQGHNNGPWEADKDRGGAQEENASLGHEPQKNIFQVPEAQILDSFLNDLINPFVK